MAFALEVWELYLHECVELFSQFGLPAADNLFYQTLSCPATISRLLSSVSRSTTDPLKCLSEESTRKNTKVNSPG